MNNNDKGVRWFQVNYVREAMKPLVKGEQKALAQSALSDAVSMADKLGIFSMSASRLAKINAVNERTARRAINTLKECGAIVLHNSSGLGGFNQDTGSGIANRYRINFKMPGVSDVDYAMLYEKCGPALRRMYEE